MLENAPEDTFLLFAAAKEFDALNKWSEAKTYYYRLLDIDQEYIGAYYHLSELHHRSEEIKKAEEIAEKGIKLAKALQDEKNLAELIQLKDSF